MSDDREPIGRKGKQPNPPRRVAGRRERRDDDDDHFQDDGYDHEEKKPVPRKGKGAHRAGKEAGWFIYQAVADLYCSDDRLWILPRRPDPQPY